MSFNCYRCSVELADENWLKSSQKSGTYCCRDCSKAQSKAARIKRKEKLDEQGTEQNKFCRECNVELNNDNWYKSLQACKNYLCKVCSKSTSTEMQIKNKDKYNARINKGNKKKRNKHKEKAMEICGNNKCACCTESLLPLLTIDHINNDGWKDRKEGSQYIYTAIVNGNRETQDLRVLCYNCNCANGFYRVCPHAMSPTQVSNCICCDNELVTVGKRSEQNFHEFLAKSGCYICIDCLILKKSGKTPTKNLRNPKFFTMDVRLKMINGYGGKCECCEEEKPMFLTIDHINEHDGVKGMDLYLRLIKEGFPKDNYRILCYNCNCSRGHANSGGLCAHKRIDIKAA